MSRTRTATATATATASPAEGGARRRHGPASASRLALLTLAVPLLLAAACSGDGGEDGAAEGQTSTTAAGDGDAQAYIDAGAASLTADEELRLDQETATCISTAAVGLVGADALARAGVSPQEFAEAETYDVLAVDIPDDAATRMSDALGSCDAAGAFTSFFADELGMDLPPEARACLDERVDRQAVHDAMANGFFAPSGEAAPANQAAFQDTLETALMDAVVACPRW